MAENLATQAVEVIGGELPEQDHRDDRWHEYRRHRGIGLDLVFDAIRRQDGSRAEESIDGIVRAAALRERLLPTLQTLFLGHDARVFGSSVKKVPGFFVPDAVPYRANEYYVGCDFPRHRHVAADVGRVCVEQVTGIKTGIFGSTKRAERTKRSLCGETVKHLVSAKSDVDIVVIVDDATFMAWQQAAYSGRLVERYSDKDLVTRENRLKAMFEVLKLDKEILTGVGYPERVIDPFLFPESFVNGKNDSSSSNMSRRRRSSSPGESDISPEQPCNY